VKAGISVQSADDGKDGTEDTTVKLWHDDADFLGEFVFTYTEAWGGAKASVKAKGVEAGFTLPYAYGWVNFLDNKVVLTAGHIDGNVWGLGKITNAFDPSFDAVKGVRINVNPFEGLDLGFALPVAGPITYYKPDGTTVLATFDRTVANVFGGAVIGALYKSSLIGAVFGLQLNPGTGKVADKYEWEVSYGDAPTDTAEEGANTVDSAKDPVWKVKKTDGVPAYDPWVDVYFGVEAIPLSILKVAVNARIDTRKYQNDKGDAINNKNGYLRIGGKVAFEDGPLSAFVVGSAVIQNDGFAKGVKGTKVVYEQSSDDFTKYYNYTHANWVNVEKVGDTSVNFEVGADYKITTDTKAYIRVGSDNVAWFEGNGAYIKPGVSFTLGSASVEIFNKLSKIGAKDIGAYEKVKKHSQLKEQFQVNFGWAF
jgi:hypothetical protein